MAYSFVTFVVKKFSKSINQVENWSHTNINKI